MKITVILKNGRKEATAYAEIKTMEEVDKAVKDAVYYVKQKIKE